MLAVQLVDNLTDHNRTTGTLERFTIFVFTPASSKCFTSTRALLAACNTSLHGTSLTSLKATRRSRKEQQRTVQADRPCKQQSGERPGEKIPFKTSR